MHYYGFDAVYWLVSIPALLLGLWAQILVKTRIARMHQMPNRLGLSGRDTAERILRANGIDDVRIEQVGGFLSDHYSPSEKVLRLSPEIYERRSVSALAVAAHEVGHAIQHQRAYAPLALRSTVAPAAAIGSNLGMLLIMFGFGLGALGLVKVGLILFAGMVFFTVITLPVEFNASSRALEQIETLQLSAGDELVAARKVLNAAALTYVAAAVSAIIQLLYFAWRAGLLGGRRND